MKLTIHMGQSVNRFHSYRTFEHGDDALAYFWAMANCNHFQRCFFFQGLDGWMTNDHLRSKPYPEHLKEKISFFVNEDNAITEEWDNHA